MGGVVRGFWRGEAEGGGRARARTRSAAFSLLELLVVLGVVAVLGGIALPAGRRALEFGRAVRTQALFAQWRAAAELYRAEYGALPGLDAGGLLESERFAAALTGRDSVGRELPADGRNGNPRGLRFLEPSATDWLRGDAPGARAVVVDAFGNSDIAVLYDHDGDGWIRGDEAALPALRRGNFRTGFGAPAAAAGAAGLPPPEIRARIAFVTVGAGDGHEPVRSWRD